MAEPTASSISSSVGILSPASSRRHAATSLRSSTRNLLYTAVGLLVLPWVGFLADTWVGAVVGVVPYIGSRIYAPAEEASLSRTFGARGTATGRG
jgi:protein-S-isoprenylcysteine O-methyltransferase Ste14